MKIVIMGTGGFIVPSLKALFASKHEIAAVITMPVRNSTKKKGGPVLPVREFMKNSAVPLYDPENINSPEGLELMDRLAPDLIFICDYGKILSIPLIQKAKYGGINLHGSLLPQYRGAAPINRAIIAGEKILGVTVIQIVPQVDAGPILATDSYSPSMDNTAVEIELELSQKGVPLVLDAIDAIEKGNIVPLDQNDQLASGAPRLKKEEGKIDWTRSAAQIIDLYRGLQPWPKTFTDWIKSENVSADFSQPVPTPVRLILGPFLEADPDQEEIPAGSAPGTILKAEKNKILVQTGQGILNVLAIQPSGKNKMTADAFLRGYKIKPNDRFV